MKTLPQDHIDELARIDSPTIANAVEKFEVRSAVDGFTGPEIKCMAPQLGPVIGYAVTATVNSSTPTDAPPRDMMEFLDAIEKSPKPVVVVLRSEGLNPDRTCVIGELISRTMMKLGAVALVTDGCVRDRGPLEQIGFPTWALGSMASHGVPATRKVNVPVDIAGMLVEPGDLIHADENGVVHIPWECADQVLQEARRVLDEEKTLIEDMSAPDFKDRIKHLFGIDDWK